MPAIAGLAELWGQTLGDERIGVAVIDGPVDLSHPVFDGAQLSRLDGIWPEEEFDGPKASHGTQVASVLFGQHEGPAPGVAPKCWGVSIPAFSDSRGRTSQLDLARGIEAAVEAGVHVINLSGGQLSPSGEADDLLDRAARLCEERNVLLVAAVGNDGCFCHHVPACLPSVLAAGALDDVGDPLESNNWGQAYQQQAILAPGANVLGAVPGSGTAKASGSSFAAPIVSGVAALLLSLQVGAGQEPDPRRVRQVLLDSADACQWADPSACMRFLAGKLNIKKAVYAMPEAGDVTTSEPVELSAGGCSCGGEVSDAPPEVPVSRAPVSVSEVAAAAEVVSAAGMMGAAGVVASGADGPVWSPLAYTLGTLGYDFGTEARRDSFKQLMTAVSAEGTAVPANPYDSRQMVDHLRLHPSEATSLIWTLNLELTPVYAIESTSPYAAGVYELLTDLLSGECAAEDDEDYIERVSVPGRLTGRTVKLFSGQVVPVIEVAAPRGLYGWNINALMTAALAAARRSHPTGETDEALTGRFREFLARVYYDLRNLGTTSADRALNFAATNAFQAADTFASAVADGMTLDTIEVEKSPFCRIDSDCWDVKLRFFDPENSRRARKVYRFTIDVSDLIPVTLGTVRTWSER
ncbi:PatA/PatG family cyanobactin maturation protease [Streptomyces gobiensis]|nr:PatA/PatG family cyanobactin maturation protease [Streptomyces gobiensis]